MRVAIVSHNRCGLNLGGLQRQIARTVEALQGLGHELVMWNSWDGVQPGEYDVAHFFSADQTLFPVLQGFAEKGIPTVVSSVLGEGVVSRPKAVVRRTLAATPFPIYQDLSRVMKLVQAADVVIALHEGEQQLVEFYGRTGPIHQIPNGVADVFMTGHAERGREIVGSDAYYVNVAQFSPRKGQRWMIDNWTSVTHDLALVGGGTVGQTDYYEGSVEAAKDRRVKLVGPLEPDSQDLADVYAGSSGLVLNSSAEVAPIVMNEAFAAGVPVVIPEHLAYDRVRKPDATFKFGDPEGFRAALKTVLTATPRDVYVPTWTDVARHIQEIYVEVTQ